MWSTRWRRITCWASRSATRGRALSPPSAPRPGGRAIPTRSPTRTYPIAAATPELVLGTQMERHVAKRLGLPCAVISAPVHVQDFPARTSPQMGFEGANVLFDTWVQPLMMGLEEHLLGMFRGDFEFHEDAAPSHLGRSQPGTVATPPPVVATPDPVEPITLTTTWTADAERELGKVPFFVRGKARRNTERYALDHGLSAITVETLYDAKAHFSR